ncbi:BtrH N-terminal domain-containing protein [Priestia koreensis]|uniref:BtrH N-terminal domain-containing protein n=1 Tax=Priestia koreensis TaxID=284581 RepID=UPI003CFE6C6E
MNEPTLYSHPHHNCLSMTITGVVHENIKPEYLWYISQLYAVTNGDKPVRFVPKIQFFDEEITKFSNIHINHQKFGSFEEYIKELDQLLEKNVPVITPVDTYHLSYSPTYKNENNFHWFEIWKNDQDLYYTIDHFFHAKSTVTQSHLKDLVSGAKEILKAPIYQLYSVSATGDSNLELMSYKQAIKDNLDAFSTKKALYKKIPYNIFESSQVIEQGIDVFNEMHKKIQYVQEIEEHEEKTALYEELYEDFFEIGNSRHIFSEFIKNFTDHVAAVEPILQIIEEVSQDYRICANLALRSTADKGKSISKLQKRLHDLKEKEIIFINELNILYQNL